MSRGRSSQTCGCVWLPQLVQLQGGCGPAKVVGEVQKVSAQSVHVAALYCVCARVCVYTQHMKCQEVQGKCIDRASSGTLLCVCTFLCVHTTHEMPRGAR
jgi:hypothetical protein